MGGSERAESLRRDSFEQQRQQKHSTQPVREHGEKKECPPTGWEYMDPKGNKQGPFKLEQMQKWFEMGAFKAELPMRCCPTDRFVPLRELFPHPMVPFLRAPKRPT